MQSHDGMESRRDHLKTEIKALLGGGSVRVELKDEQIEIAIDIAVQTYRQRSSGSVEEAWLHMTLEEGQSTYTLPQEVQQVRKIYRRGHGQMGQTAGANLDPFSLAYANSYMLSAAKGGGGGLLTYELQHQMQETMGKMFGREINFNYNHVTKQMTIHRDVHGQEDVLLWAYHFRPEENLHVDFQAGPWIRDWALAECKIILGRVRGKISSIPGPNGPISLNGDALVQEGKEDHKQLLEDMKRYTAGGAPLGFLIG